MKILAIRIKNLASLEGTTEIDFTIEPLCSAGIFAITGPTGAGKSTILDALCLGLYAKTPRYLQAKESGIEIYDVPGSTISQGDVRGILRDGTGDGFAEVDFVGIDAQKYSARWTVKRARNKAGGSLQSDTIDLRNISTNTPMPGRKTETLKAIERLIGLSFEQFTRSVLLAQGDFTAFLKADKDEKASLLEKLTGTSVYTLISMKVHGRCKSEAQELRELHIRKEGILILTEEELQSLGTQMSTINEEIHYYEKEVEGIGIEIGWHTRLADLESNYKSALMNHQQALTNKETAMEREQRLHYIEQVQKIRGKVEGRDDIKRQLNEKSAELKSVQEKLIALRHQSLLAESSLTNAHEDIARKVKAHEDAIPLLDQAKELDTRVTEVNKQRKQAKEEIENATLSCNSCLDQLNKQRQEADCLLKAINKLESWKNANEARRPVAENQKLIVSKLEDAKILLENSTGILNKMREAGNSLLKTREELFRVESQFADTRKQLHDVQIEYEDRKKELEAISIDHLEEGKASNEEALSELISALAHWKVAYGTLTAVTALKAKQSANKQELLQKTTTSEQVSEMLKTAQIKKETSGQILEKARLKAANDVEAIRSGLVEGEPCPVCGSTVHPYTAHEMKFDQLLAGIEEEHRSNETQYFASLNELNSLQSDCKHLQRSINVDGAEINEKEIVLNDLMKSWSEFAVYKTCSDLPDQQKSEWMQNNIRELKTKQAEFTTRIRAFNTKHKNLHELKTRIEKLDKEQSATTVKIKDIERTLLSKQETIDGCAVEQEKNNGLLNSVEQSLSAYFINPNWFGDWKSKPEPFLKMVHEFAELWRNNHERLVADTQKHRVLTVTISTKENQYKDLEEEVRKRTIVQSTLESNYQELSNKRKAIFNGEAVQAVEARLRVDMKTAQSLHDKLKAEQDALGSAIILAEAGKTYAEKDIIAMEQAEQALCLHISQWINTFNGNHNTNLDDSKLINLLHFTPAWTDQERAALRGIQDAVTETVSVLQDRKITLQEHEERRMSARTPDELRELLKEQRDKLESVRSSKNEIVFKLQQDKQNKQQIGDLLLNIDAKTAIAENWSKLDDIIGSSDGKRFRQIAQEYTLDVLLSYANIQLEMLTKRYRLQRISNSLGLQVLDHEMGNEIRTVYSLSGGESFLVSLALALGLASLSSSRLQVESLFIDEGFGALDPTTLNIAMDALERLQYQGRKVSVISHVEEMTERIPVQIKVSKLSNGKSMVEISTN